MNTDKNTNVSKLINASQKFGCRIVAYGPPSHPKGKKKLMNIRYGELWQRLHDQIQKQGAYLR